MSKFLALLCLSVASALASNPLLFWNEQALNATRLSRNPPPVAALHLASYHGALAETVNGIRPQWTPVFVQEKAPEGANLEAALAGCAHRMLRTLWGQSSNPENFDLALQEALKTVPAGPGRDKGLAWGQEVAMKVLAIRSKAGLDRPFDGVVSSTEPGRWRETPAGFRPAVLPQIARVTPFVLSSPSQFRSPPPPALDSRQYAEELAQTARLGARDGAERTEEQTLSTPFWADDLGTATPAGHWNVIAQDLARRQRLGVEDCARLFALLNYATADAGISSWDTKFFYQTWRPETALRELTKERNPHHVPVPDFIPIMASPAHPDYTSGHSSFSGAATRLLELYFGTDQLSFTTTSDGLPGAVRSYHSLSAAREEIGMSRIYGGIHTMSANLAGQKAGMQVADWVFAQALKPLR